MYRIKVVLEGVLLLLLPMIGWGQSEVTRRVSAAEMGYRGRVRMVQSSEYSRQDGQLSFSTTAEAYNEAGMRTAMSTSDGLYQQNYLYHYSADGQLTYYVGDYGEGGKDSIVFHYTPDGCLLGYEEYFLSADPTEGNSVTDHLLSCDAHCRVLYCASAWGDTTMYEYDHQGRLLKKTLSGQPTKAVTYDYDRHGRLERIRIGDEHFEDTHYRYDANGDTVKVWHTNWEHLEGETGQHEVGQHRHYDYTRYDDHGNWTQATVTVLESGKTQKLNIIRTFSYYD